MTPRRARNDRTDAIDKAELIQKADPKDPIEPTEQAEPIEPIESTEPLDAIERNESLDHSDHFEVFDCALAVTRRIVVLARLRGSFGVDVRRQLDRVGLFEVGGSADFGPCCGFLELAM